MRLNELLKCVAVDSVKYKNYKRRGQLPFRDKEEFSIPPGEKLHTQWADFSLEDALRLQVMVDLSDYKSLEPQKGTDESKLYDGLPPMSASSIASEGIHKSFNKYRGLSGIRCQDFDIWHVVMVNASMYQGKLCYGMDRFSGSLSECAQKIEELKKGQVRAVLFNVSQALERVLSAGETAKVAEVLEFIEQRDA